MQKLPLSLFAICRQDWWRFSISSNHVLKKASHNVQNIQKINMHQKWRQIMKKCTTVIMNYRQTTYLWATSPIFGPAYAFLLHFFGLDTSLPEGVNMIFLRQSIIWLKQLVFDAILAGPKIGHVAQKSVVWQYLQ